MTPVSCPTFSVVCNLGRGCLSPILSLLCHFVIYGKCLLCSKQPNKMNDIQIKLLSFLYFFAVKLLLIKHNGPVPAPCWRRLHPFEQYWLEIHFSESLNSQKIGLKLHHTCQFSFPIPSELSGSQGPKAQKVSSSGCLAGLIASHIRLECLCTCERKSVLMQGIVFM